MSRYEGLDPKLKAAVFSRDNWRCRWCGATNAMGYDAHHIEYRRGYSYDRLDNLITLCRGCHSFVHDSYQIPKQTAQLILFGLIADEGAGATGMAAWRQKRKETEQEDDLPESDSDSVGRLLSGEALGGRLMKGLEQA